MFYLKEHTCGVCGCHWSDNLDSSVCPKTLDHTQIIRERILGIAAKSDASEKAEVAPLAAKNLPAEK